MEEDILNYLPTVVFRGTPCITHKNLTKTTFILFIFFQFLGRILEEQGLPQRMTFS